MLTLLLFTQVLSRKCLVYVSWTQTESLQWSCLSMHSRDTMPHSDEFNQFHVFKFNLKVISTDFSERKVQQFNGLSWCTWSCGPIVQARMLFRREVSKCHFPVGSKHHKWVSPINYTTAFMVKVTILHHLAFWLMLHIQRKISSVTACD